MKVLIIAPHPDDEIIGVGGTIAKRINQGHEVYVCIVTKGKEPLFDEEFINKSREECRQSHEFLGVKKTYFLNFPAVMLEDVPRYKLNDSIFKVIQTVKPDEVYIPHRGDMQLDHKLVVDACMVALRPKYSHRVLRIYSYETLSETGWDLPNIANEFIPTVFEDISETLDKKLMAMSFFKTQLNEFPHARSLLAIEALSKYRGSLMTMKAAEAFYLVREIKL